nr:hypothetical protein [uncultured Campylobacter sp.]
MIVSARDAIEKQKPPKFASLKFNADFIKSAKPQPPNLQSRAD